MASVALVWQRGREAERAETRRRGREKGQRGQRQRAETKRHDGQRAHARARMRQNRGKRTCKGARGFDSRMSTMGFLCASATRISNWPGNEKKESSESENSMRRGDLQNGRERTPALRKIITAPLSIIPCRMPSLVRSSVVWFASSVEHEGWHSLESAQGSLLTSTIVVPTAESLSTLG